MRFLLFALAAAVGALADGAVQANAHASPFDEDADIGGVTERIFTGKDLSRLTSSRRRRRRREVHRLGGDDEHGSYRAAEVNKNPKVEIHRLAAQARLWFPKERPKLLELGLEDGMTVLDLGCGPGFLSAELLKSFPKLRVAGIEIDPKLLAHANGMLETTFPKRWRGLHMSIAHMKTIESNSVDFAISRYVFQHLPQPELALKEAYRVLKPGGVLVVLDVDEAIAGVFSPGRSFLIEQQTGGWLTHATQVNGQISSMFSQMQAHDGGNRMVGRRLFPLFRHAGFQELDEQLLMVSSDEYGMEAFHDIVLPDARAWDLYRKGMIDDTALQINEHMLARFLQDPESAMYDVEWVMKGTKPHNHE